MSFISYSSKPDPIFGYKHDRERAFNHLMFGVEVEVEPDRNRGTTMSAWDCSELADTLGEGRIYCKEDGSLSDGGLEIISHPGTLGHHMYVMRWKRLLKAVQKTGRRSHDALHCGLHVHIGRNEMGQTESERDKVVRMWQVLMSRFSAEFMAFSRRRQNQIDRWAPIPNRDWTHSDSAIVLEDEAEMLDTYDSWHSHRYTAVNITNRSTVEIRIFKGTLKRDTLIAAIQLCSNVTEWCMDHDWADIPNTPFTAIACYKPYHEVVEYMRGRNLLDESALPTAMTAISTRCCDFTTGNA